MNHCGTCSECCKLLEIKELRKPWNVPCMHLAPGGAGCGVYEKRPISCQIFKCLWLAIAERVGGKTSYRPELRPERTHVVFYRNGSEADPRTIFAHVDPKFPTAWFNDAVNGEIGRLVREGAIVIVVIGERRIIIEDGKPIIRTTESEILRRQGQSYAERRILWRPANIPEVEI